MVTLYIIPLTLAAYLLGAIPFALLIGRMQGVDVRTVGSGNVGATNVFRSVGKGWGALTFALDVLKGFLAAFLLPLCFPVEAVANHAGLIYGCAAIAGHNWPVYLKFKGGKGVATSAGVVLGVAPVAVGVGLAGWVLFFAVSRYVSMASVLGALVIAAAGWWRYGAENPVLAGVLTVLSALVIWRHRSNMGRLVEGTEPRFDVWCRQRVQDQGKGTE